MKSIALLALGMILSGTTFADVGNRGTEGHGGDPLRRLFDDARGYTVERIEHALACSFPANTRGEVVNWIMTRKFDLANDVRNSPHNWVTDAQSTCAFTQTNRQAPITLSFEACRPNIREVNDAIFMLTHESAHHFGIVDEAFADEVGRAIQRLGQDCSCNPVPGTDPFDPNSCPGRDVSASELYSWIPLPETSKKLGDFKAHIRQRTCYNERFCTAWVESRDTFLVQQKYRVNQTGSIFARLIANKAVLFSDSPIDQGVVGWSTYGEIDPNQTLRTTYLGASGQVFLGRQEVMAQDFNHKLTATCYRGTVSKSHKTKDQNQNDITIETDMVILSQFK